MTANERLKRQKIKESIDIGKVRIRNRLVMPPMVMCYAEPDGTINEQVLAHYETCARGGIGLILTEASIVHESGKGFESELWIDRDTLIPRFKTLTDSVKVLGARIGMQLYHGGIQANVEQPVGPSAIRRVNAPAKKVPRALSTRETEDMVTAFADAARRAQAAGFDCVEVHGTHGYLVNSFMSDLTNKRTDRYGADKALFATEIVEQIKANCGADFPVIFRLCSNEYEEGGITLEMAVAFAKRLREAGVDAFHVTGGTYKTMEKMIAPAYFDDEGHFLDAAATIRKNVDAPVISGGMMHHPEAVENALARGHTDLVFLGRQLLADPEWPNKVMQGNESEIRHCIACQVCLNDIMCQHPVQCSVNPLKGMEYRYLNEDAIPQTDYPMQVAIVGAGLAGMEAGRIAHRMGHQVTIYEQADHVGGVINLVRHEPIKKRIDELVGWYENAVASNGITLQLKTVATAETIRNAKPDAVVLATGTDPIEPAIPGVEHAIQSDELWKDRNLAGESVIIIGGGSTGCELAFELAEDGKAVTLLEALDDVAQNEPVPAKLALVARMKAAGVKCLLRNPVVQINEGFVNTVDESGQRHRFEAETVVLSLGRKPAVSSDLLEAAEEACGNVQVIGDAQSPGRIQDAIRAGFSAALQLQ
jgi:2,4-dienoyl-CoA reductase-like NADH-dependent reductase (Old Yellow Enzyme family)/NADH dehydrogenase FAD-containing subunit